jgi:DNA-binding HxlR family transcriptional regulator
VSDTKNSNDESLYKRIKLLSNKKKFEIVRATQTERKNIKELSKQLKLAYNKCSNYVTDLAKQNFVIKERVGKEVFVKSNVRLSDKDLNPEKNSHY